jgi:hypothetical protein
VYRGFANSLKVHQRLRKGYISSKGVILRKVVNGIDLEY